jgi:nicotinate-nucleotide adenylyltransferase
MNTIACILVHLAVEGDLRLKASEVEFKLPRPSYTIDTLTYLQEKYPQHEFSIIMGSDSFQNLPKWKNFELLIKNYSFIIYKRPGFEVKDTWNASVTILEAPLLQLSATEIRDNIKSGKTIRYLVPDKVREEIEQNSYYK